MHENHEIWTWRRVKCEEKFWFRHSTLNPYAKGHTKPLTLICDLSLEAKCMTISVVVYRLDAWFLHGQWSSNEACHTSLQSLWYALSMSRKHQASNMLLRNLIEDIFIETQSIKITAGIAQNMDDIHWNEDIKKIYESPSI